MDLTIPKAVAATIASARGASGIPADLKAPVDLLGLVEKYAKAHRKVRVPRGGRVEYFDDGDAPDFGPIQDEVERLHGMEYLLGEVLDASTGVLLVLSRLQAHLDGPALELVQKFRAAVAEAHS